MRKLICWEGWVGIRCELRWQALMRRCGMSRSSLWSRLVVVATSCTLSALRATAAVAAVDGVMSPRMTSLCLLLGLSVFTARCTKKGKGVCKLFMEIHLTTTECHLPYGITQCYLPPDTSEHTPPLYPARQAGTRFTDHLRVEGSVSQGPGCKEQLAHGCYATARASETRTHDLANAGRARLVLGAQ